LLAMTAFSSFIRQSHNYNIMKNQERLQKFISRCGITSRRKAESLIAQGRVSLNGEVVTQMGIRIDPDRDVVEVDGKKIISPTNFTYYALNKPWGFISTMDDPHASRKVVDLVPGNPRVFPAGRLDRDSEGLMILTNDGDLMQKLTHPSFSHEKEYIVDVFSKNRLTINEVADKLKIIKGGMELDDGTTRPADVRLGEVDGNLMRFRIIIKEGRKRQIRRMCSAVGLEVKRLIRIRIGNLRLGNLESGKYRRIDRELILKSE